MAGIVIVALVVFVLVVATRYGYDSRESVRSKEQELASHGMSWADDQAYQQQLADELGHTLRQFPSGPLPVRQMEQVPSRDAPSLVTA
jgi:hypothetical protein